MPQRQLTTVAMMTAKKYNGKGNKKQTPAKAPGFNLLTGLINPVVVMLWAYRGNLFGYFDAYSAF